MKKECLEYSCEMPHHENEEMALRLEYSQHHEDIIIDMELDNGLADNGKKSRITLTASELREVIFIANKYAAACGILEINEGLTQ